MAADRVREVAEQVLSRPEFEPARPSLLDRVFQAFTDAFVQLLEAASAGGGSLVGGLVVAGVVLAVAVLVARFARNVRTDPSRGEPLAGQVGRTPADWRGDAETARRQGQWREAVRCEYRALLATLAVAGLVEEVPGRTSGEYLARFRQDVPAAADAFADATADFETAWYGPGPVGEQDVAAMVDAVGDVERATGVRAGAR